MLKIAFLGDISLNNCYNQFNKDGVNPFLGVEQLLKKSNFNIGNLECLAKGEQGENELKNPRLNTDKSTLSSLSSLNLKIVTLAHNHIYDNLVDGYNKTIEQLVGQQIEFLGAGLTENDAQKELIINHNGIKLGLLNYVTKNTNPKMPEDAEVYLNYFDIEKIELQIKSLKLRVDQVIVLLHWGGRVEEGYYPDFNQPSLARKMIKAGADLIVGGHSHTVQPYEVYKGKHIFYSLGNFCFDDIVQGDEVFEIGRFRKRKTIIPLVTFSKTSYTVNISHAKNKKGYILNNDKFLVKVKMHWRNFLFQVVKNNYFIWRIYFWHLKKIVPIKMYFIEANEGIFKRIIKLDHKMVIRYIFK